jgi:hypothetical protein
MVKTIFITGSKIFARSGENGAGIGSGRESHGNSTVSLVLIENSTVTATPGYLASGIGNRYASFGQSSIEVLSILRSTIDSSGSRAAAIGSGRVRKEQRSFLNYELTIQTSK